MRRLRLGVAVVSMAGLLSLAASPSPAGSAPRASGSGALGTSVTALRLGQSPPLGICHGHPVADGLSSTHG